MYVIQNQSKQPINIYVMGQKEVVAHVKELHEDQVVLVEKKFSKAFVKGSFYFPENLGIKEISSMVAVTNEEYKLLVSMNSFSQLKDDRTLVVLTMTDDEASTFKRAYVAGQVTRDIYRKQ